MIWNVKEYSRAASLHGRLRERGQIDGEGKRCGGGGGGGGVKNEETLQDEGAAEEKGQLLFLSYGNGNEVGHGAWDNGGPQAGWASPCKLLPVREPFSPHFYWLTSHLHANYKGASPSKLEAAAVCGVQIGFSQASSHLLAQCRPVGGTFKCACVFFNVWKWWRVLTSHILRVTQRCFCKFHWWLNLPVQSLC